MEIYDGKYNILTQTQSDTVTSKGNQMFITFKTDDNEVGKGFTATITFGIRTIL